MRFFWIRLRIIDKNKKFSFSVNYDFLNKQTKPLEESLIWKLISQIASALQYLHQNNVIHRNIKPDNIYITQNLDIKLGDFGISRIFDINKPNHQTLAGTYQYMSPEMLERKSYSFETDIWSFGVVAFELITFQRPFGDDILNLGSSIKSKNLVPFPSHYSGQLKDLALSMLMITPSTRVTFKKMKKFGVNFES